MITPIRMKKMLDGHFHDEWVRILEDISITRQARLRDPSSNQVNIHPTVMSDFLIHFRILHEFFYGNPRAHGGENANVKHYIPSWNKREPKRIQIWNGRINEFLTHLSYSRARGWIPWPFQKLLYPHYKMLTLRFIKNLPPNHRSSELESLKQRLTNEDFVI
ncbi:MAG TPA: hypothetical protein ENH99_02215 [Candidatus Pacearchaeota archaeon]|nr:hypothetical protein [Candidatus Pacearchaeota archaeon]